MRERERDVEEVSDKGKRGVWLPSPVICLLNVTYLEDHLLTMIRKYLTMRGAEPCSYLAFARHRSPRLAVIPPTLESGTGGSEAETALRTMARSRREPAIPCTMQLTIGIEVEILLKPKPVMDDFLDGQGFDHNVWESANREPFQRALIVALASQGLRIGRASTDYNAWAVTDEPALEETWEFCKPPSQDGVSLC